ncbi:FAD-dependent oxidoreductase [Lentzea sp. NPDC004782]|uniref:FAD-dependent oxidoreductase n=1 Tax=Lentzea sp. NPDC004782 TaxID=3154458 RepID=UPI0033B36B73
MSIAVVGGGIVGLSCAWSLHRRGFDVTVLDAGRFGGEVSAVNAGWVTPSLSTPLATPGILRTGVRQAFDQRGSLVIRPRANASWIRWLWRFRAAAAPEAYKRGVKALLELNDKTLDLFDEYRDSGVDFEMHSTGILALARDHAHLSWFTQLFDELGRLGFQGDIEYLSPEQARVREPALGDAVGAAARTSIDRHVDPMSLTAGLADYLRRRDVRLLEHTPVEGMVQRDERWVLATPSGSVQADNVVVALGVATNSLLRPLGVRIPILGAKGYSIDLQGEGQLPTHALYLMEPKVGLSPLSRGLRIAGIFELGGQQDNEVVPRRIRQIVEDTMGYLRDWQPGMTGYESQGTAGLRPATPDSLPFLGPIPQLPGVYLATGHGMLGVTLAPASGEAIADMVETRTVPETLFPFQLAGRL